MKKHKHSMLFSLIACIVFLSNQPSQAREIDIKYQNNTSFRYKIKKETETVINRAPKIIITSPNDNSVYKNSQGLSVKINTDDNDSRIVKHQVYINDNLVDTDGSNYTDHPLTNLRTGSYTVRVVVTNIDGVIGQDTISFSINEGNNCDIYEEKDGLVVIEAENLSILGDWNKKNTISGFTGSGYLEWTGPNHFNAPGNGLINAKIKINSPGRYKFQWRSKVGEGESATEANDTWLKFPDADAFYAQKGSEKIYPKGSGLTPNPEGAGGQGYFKVYSTGTTNWTWTTKTSDKDPHDIFIEFDSPGVYTMLISGRSKHHVVDRVTLNKSSVNATIISLEETKCQNNGQNNSKATITGELKKWHNVVLTFNGPNTSETAADNPFLNYRLNVTFTHQSGSPSYVVPGYYAADGNAAQTSATSGNKWRVHFAPDKTGTWNYKVSFRKGRNIAVNENKTVGTVAGFMDGEIGSFKINTSDKSGRDFRAKGRLQYVGEHYLRFAETGEYMIKQGPDSPENLFAYNDFDNTPNVGNRRKDYRPHIRDWNSGNPTWKNGKGKGLIGAVNYVASEGLNSMSFLTMNIDGDDENVYPYVSSNQRTRMDVSKLSQWAIVVEHMQKNGIFAHFKTQETENESLLDGGNTGVQRKLYYRELIARFGYNLALNWNLGEENGVGPQPINQSPEQQKAMAAYFYKNDPYKHHIVIHTYPNDFPDHLLGNQSKLTGFSLQTNQPNFSSVFGKVKEGVDKSKSEGKKWAIACDEPGDAGQALRPDNNPGNSHIDGRKNALWGTLLAGGWGNEWYFGYLQEHSDLTLQDFRSRDKWWDYPRYAIRFFDIAELPLTQMKNNNSLSSNASSYCYAKQGEAYVVYLKEGGSTSLNLIGQRGSYTVKWYDPRNGGNLVDGSVTTINGGGKRPLGNAPNNGNKDWVLLITKKTSNLDENQAPIVSFALLSENTTIQEGYTNFELEVDASDSDGSISNVKLFVDDRLVRQESTAPYKWGRGNNVGELLGLSVGNHIITAVATDNDGATAETTFTLKVVTEVLISNPISSIIDPSENITLVSNDESGNNRGCSFNMPNTKGIPAMNNSSYTNVHFAGKEVLGLNNFKELTIHWDPVYNTLYKFAINTDGKIHNLHMNLSNIMSYQLKNAQPEVTLINTDIVGLDGEYWVTKDGDNFIMESKDKDFMLYFSNSATPPSCLKILKKVSIPKENLLNIKLYPNPVENGILLIKGIKNKEVSIQVLSLIGQVVLHKNVKEVNEYQLPVETLDVGSYILKIKGKDVNTSLHFIKK
ncbi:DUF5060 domain-containing protein [Aquimarina sp. W85]|uniref:DUF5060 domain-containing protein n=1 Tax=Aquimarina rhodophyticola TaxID=3342246 RepID=UPI003672A0AE